MGTRGWTLVLDFGTTTTTGVLADASGTTLLEVDGTTRLPSVIRRDADGTLVVGAGAEGSGWPPDTVERTPKRALGRVENLVLGGVEVPIADAVAALLRAFAEEGARHRNGAAPVACVLTHPASWDAGRREALAGAARRAGLPEPRLVPEPVAAALHRGASAGELVAVYDLGGGTFDTAVLRSGPDGFALVGEPGGAPELGGEQLDDLLFRHVGEQVPAVWEQLRAPDSPVWRRRAAELRREVRRAKEALSRTTSHTVHVDAAEAEITITRAELEELVRPVIAATVAELLVTVRRAGVEPAALSTVYLVGGASRIPLVARLVEEATGLVPQTYDDPKTVVVLGAARLATPAETATDTPAAAPEPAPAPVDPAGAPAPVDPAAGYAPVDPTTARLAAATAAGSGSGDESHGDEGPGTDPTVTAPTVPATGHPTESAALPPTTPLPAPGWRRPRVLVPVAAVLVVLMVAGGLVIGLTRTSTPVTELAAESPARATLSPPPAPSAQPRVAPTPSPTPVPLPEPPPAAVVAAPQPAPVTQAVRPAPQPVQQAPAPRPAVTLAISGPQHVDVGAKGVYSVSSNDLSRITGCTWTDPNGQTFPNCRTLTVAYHGAGTWTIRLTATTDDGQNLATTLTTYSP